ncbi:MAG: MASE3 domain-containing protein [Sideroxydans sp.]|nr:MASE3 domain-containing protein [Sideroxydans sp.]
MSNHSQYLHRLNRLLIGLTLLFLLAWQLPELNMMKGENIMPLSLHIALETFAIVVAMMVFGITWNTYSPERSANTVILAAGFLLVGLLDFGHMFSFSGMPDFVTPSSPEKAIQFWLSARFSVAAILLLVSLRAWQRPLQASGTRNQLLVGSVLVAFAIYWLILIHPEVWPHTFIEGMGLTPFKIGSEYALILMLTAAGVMFYRQAQHARDAAAAKNAGRLWAACLISVLSELCFVLYSAVSDIFNMLGHVYKVIGYLFIYRAVFIENVREPYVRLGTAQDALSTSQMMLQSILDHVPVRIFWKDTQGRYLGSNKHMATDIGLQDAQQMIGKDDYAFYPVDQAAKFRSDDLEVMLSARPKLNIEEPITLKDGKEGWLLTNKVPLQGLDGEVNGVLGAYTDITPLRNTEMRLEEANRQLRELTVRREEAREEERKRIAQDLHDDLGQMLTSLRMEIGVIRLKYGDVQPELLPSLQSVRTQIDATIQVVRDVASQLRPAVLDMGISSALEWQVAEFKKRSGIPCELVLDEQEMSLEPEQATTIFRIVQESFTNIMRHAQATRVEVRLCRQENLCMLEIKDNGVGFEPGQVRKKTFGVMGMRERALVLGSELEIDSAPGKGTRISVRIKPCYCGREND